jgi:uncharacterized membrane protein YebE (DUF533 family)
MAERMQEGPPQRAAATALPPRGETQSDADEAAREAGPAEHDESMVEVLASKILVDWLRNRRQLLVPLTIDLQKLEAAQVGTLIDAVAAAAQAEGAQDGSERERASAALQLLRPSEEHSGMLAAALERRKPLSAILSAVKDVQAGALVYAVSLLAVDRRKLVNRHYLRYLAARLQLPRDLARNLEQRFRAG